MLTVLSVAYPFAPVDDDPIGGAEQVLSGIDRALVARGHRSFVLACAGSRVRGQLVASPAVDGPLHEARCARARAAYREALEDVLAREPIDVVHFHGIDCSSYFPRGLGARDVPKLVTLHLPLDWYPPGALEPAPSVSFNCVSAWQRWFVPSGVRVHATIENGVDLARWRPLAEPPEDYAVCLGRVCPEKAFDVALRAAHRAELPLYIAGRVYPYADHERHFERDLRPLLDEERRFLGPVSGEAKRQLLARARCLVVPSRVAETSSLVCMEALACGTPVIVTRAGAPHTLIEPGVTGLIADGEDALVAALSEVRALDRRACRWAAERRFDASTMVARYLDLYRELAEGAPRFDQTREAS